MKKVFVLAHQSERARLIDELQSWGYVQITTPPAPEPGEPHVPTSPYEEEAERLELHLSRVQFVLDFLLRFQEERRGFIASLMKPRVEVTWAEFSDAEGKIDFESLYETCEALDDRLRSNDQHINRLRVENERLEPWLSLDIPLSTLVDTPNAVVRIGAVSQRVADQMAGELAQEIADADLNFINEARSNAYFVLMTHRTSDDRTRDVLGRFGFEPADLSGFVGSPAGELAAIAKRMDEIAADSREARQAAAGEAALIPELYVLKDWLANRRRRWQIDAAARQTAATFVLEGWVDADDATTFEKALTGLTDVVDYGVVDPLPDERPPVVLKNPAIIKPFEMLTNLYGLPNYNEQDPTPVMAPFFFLFFGLALGDFGYGLVLALTCQLLKRRLPISDIGARWLDLFTLGGVSSMIVGILTGGYFGIEISSLPAFLQRLVVIDPLKQAFIFLLITWLLGVIHLLVGLIVETIDNQRHGPISDVIYDQVSTLLLFAAAALAGGIWLLTTVLGTGRFLLPVLPVALQLLLLGAIAVVIFQGRFFSHYVEVLSDAATSVRESAWRRLVLDQLPAILAVILLVAGLLGIPGLLRAGVVVFAVGMATSSSTRTGLARLGSGAYSLYGMSGFLGDVLSYSRLMALGLATVLIGFVINTFIRISWGLPLPVAIVFSIFLAVVGHGVNLLINLLGAFVHPLRLQFVEFFKYFYEDGGRGFRPFGFETEHLLFKDRRR